MTRPAVVVGLGGTGQWVLTYLKRELLIAGQGKLPSNVRFLSFDTMPQADVAVRTVQGKNEDQIAVGSVKLTGEEFVHMGGNAHSLSEKLMSGEPEYAHIAKWFRNREWRSILPPASWNLDEGAGRVRQLGRLATFKDLLNLQAGSRVWRALKRAIEDVKSQGQISDEQPLEIILVGSFAGGTGSGCFLDIALLLRHLSRDISHALRGYFVLPTAFSSEPTNEMKARSFAAWRELNRFMLVNPDFPIRVDYSTEDTQFQVVLNKRLFDICYLVDGYRMGSSLNAEPRYSVFPTIAEAITTLLDEAGTEYIRTIVANLLPVYLQRRSVPLYSALGSYSFKVPAYYLQQESGHKFGLTVLRNLLGTEPSIDKASRSAGIDRIASIRALATTDQNQEAGIGNAGRRETGGFLSSSAIHYKEETANPTTFTAKIAYIAHEGGPRNDKLIEEHANAVLNPIKTAKQEDPSWLRPFTDLGDDPNIQKLRDEVNTEIRLTMTQQFGRRQGDSNQQALKRLDGINDFIFKHYGGDTSAGEVDGLFGDTLKLCQQFHANLFRQMLRLVMLRILMGTSPDDPIRARSGKIGYLYDFLDGLVDTFEQTRQFLEAVQVRREQNRPRLKLEGLAQSARKIAESTGNKKFFYFFDHPAFQQDLVSFLQAQQRLVDLRKEELLHKYVMHTLEEIQQITQQARAQVESWIWHLSLGDAASGTIGLYDHLQKNLELVRANHSVDRQLSGNPLSERPGIQQLLHDEDITSVDQAEIQRVLQRLEWHIEYKGSQLLLQAAFQPSAAGDAVLALDNPQAARTDQERQFFSEHNRSTLVAVSSRSFDKPMQGLRVAPLVMATYPNPQRLAEDVLDKRAEPLANVTSQDAPKRSAILRVASVQNDTTRAYFTQVEQALRGAKQAVEKDDTFFVQVINSAHPYACTLIRTDELYQYKRFRAWESCQSGFDSYVFDEGQDPTLIHNFAAEANAARYERQLAKSGQQKGALHPWVVMLLDEEQRFRQAIYSILMGFFAPHPSGDNFVWKLQLPQPRGNPVEIILSQPGRQDELLFNALYNFVIRGQDIRPNYGQLRVFPLRPDDPNLVVEAIRRTQAEWGHQKELEIWEGLLDRTDMTTFLAWLRGIAADNNVQRDEFNDLATLIELVLRDRIAELGKEDVSPLNTSQTTPQVSTPWRVSK